MDKKIINVTVWNEYGENQRSGKVAEIYPNGMHGTIADFLKVENDIKVITKTLNDEDSGLSDEVLDNTDVLIWWGHCLHHLVPDERAAKVRDRVQQGMGIIFLHSAHKSKPFMWLTGSSGRLKWREANEREHIHVVDRAHEIAVGLGDYFTLEHEETYGESFDIPNPDSVVFIGWFEGGEVFRSGVTFRRGSGKMFYFQPGHETLPTYHHKDVQRVILNAVRWAKPNFVASLDCPNVPPIEKIGK